MGFSFEWTFRVGDFLTVIGACVMVAAFLYKRGGLDVAMKLTLESLTQEMKDMKAEFKEFSLQMRQVAVQEKQIAMLMGWYDELRRGKGIIHEE